MKNVYVEKMRQVMSAYNDLLAVRNREIAHNKEIYSPTAAEAQNEELYQLKNQDYEDSRREIEGIFGQLKDLLCKASYPVTSELTPDAEVLLNPLIHHSDFEVKALVDKYQKEGNFTMLRAISTWCEKNGIDDIQIHLPSDVILAYQKLAQAAMFTIDGIHSEKKQHFIPVEIDSFGDPIACKNELEIIGSGEQLKMYESKSVPNMVLHTYDAVTL